MIKKIMNFFYKSLILTKNNEDNNCYLKNFLFEIIRYWADFEKTGVAACCCVLLRAADCCMLLLQ
jgi:hypothetical protein